MRLLRSQLARCQSDLFSRGLHRGAGNDLATLAHPSTLSRCRMITTPSGLVTFHLASGRALLGLAAYLGHDLKMLRLRFYNRRSRYEHPLSTSPSETTRRALWETRQRLTWADRTRFGEKCCHFTRRCPAPDHLAVIQPPTVACLTAGGPASARPTLHKLSPLQESSGAFSADRPLFRSKPLTSHAPSQRWSRKRSHLRMADRGLLGGTSMPARRLMIEMPSVL